MKRSSDKLYRFALYGCSGSGKTCFLATMAMGAIGQGRHLTCERMPVTVPAPLMDTEAGKLAVEEESHGLHAGKEWIDEAIRALEAGERPEGNRPQDRAVREIVDFKIGSPDRGDFLVRTVDYAGELLHPDEEHKEDSLVNDLKACLANFDGLVIIAEALHASVDTPRLEDDLRRLRESFASLYESNEDSVQTPVAIAITKWDRWSDIDHANPEEERDKLEAYLKERLPHSSLVDTVSNAQAEQENGSDISSVGMFFGNCGVFPTTAFGQAEERDGGEYPVLGKQRPFGLLEPFAWLAERRDLLDASRLEQEWQEHLKPGWLPWKLHKTWKLSRSAKQLLKRVPRKTTVGSRVQRVRRAAKWSFRVGMTLVVLLVLTGVDLTVEGVRTWQFHEAAGVVKDPSTTVKELDVRREWFDHYSRTWNGVLLSPATEDALEQVSQIDRKIDSSLWEQVTATEDIAVKVKAAQDYLRDRPNGRHSAECKTIVTEREAALARQENAGWLSDQQNTLEAAASEEELSVLNEDLQQLLPAPHYASDEQRERLREMRDHTASRLAEIRSKEKWQRFVEAYSKAINQNDSIEAARLLETRQPRDNRWVDMVHRFLLDVHTITERLVEKHLRDKRFDDAESVVEDGKRALKDLELTLRSDDASLAAEILETQRQLMPLDRRVNELHDKHVYRQVFSRRDDEACRRYLEHAPLKSMTLQVEEFSKYLEKMADPLTVNVDLRIKWDKDYDYGHDNVVRVLLDDMLVLKTAEIGYEAGNLSGVVGSFQIKSKRIGDSVTLRVTIVEEDGPFRYPDDAGQGSATFKIRELIAGRSIPLRPADGSPIENEARLQITKKSSPQEPELPPWKAP